MMDTESAAKAGEDLVSPGGEAWYLYGITLWGNLEIPPLLNQTLLSRESAETQILQCGDLALVVKPVHRDDFTDEALARHLEDPDRLQTMVHHHNAVITSIHQQRPILPAKFGSVYDNVQDLTAAIEGIRDQLRDWLVRLQGTDEWAVHVYVDRVTIEQRAIGQSPALQALDTEIAAARPGRAYFLQRRRTAMVRAEAERVCRDLAQDVFKQFQRCALSGQVGASRGDLPSHGEDVEILRAAFLVPRMQSDAFLAVADAAADNDEGVRIEATGPWPPYSFVGSLQEEQR